VDEPHRSFSTVDDRDTTEHRLEPPNYPRTEGDVRVPERRLHLIYTLLDHRRVHQYPTLRTAGEVHPDARPFAMPVQVITVPDDRTT
jgi:hypothetical protein